MIGKIVHAGAVQIFRTRDDVCFFQVKADTFLTIVNPAERLLVSCADVPTEYLGIEGKVTLYDGDGMYVGYTMFKVPPKGNRTISLAKLLISSDHELEPSLKKYTYDIVWYARKLVNHLEELGCRIPFIPISVEVKEIIFKEWLCDPHTRAAQDILLNEFFAGKVMTMSETILDKSNVIYSILTAEEVTTTDTPSTETKPAPTPVVTIERETRPILETPQVFSPSQLFTPANQRPVSTWQPSIGPLNIQPFDNFIF